jgi:hypothetical protein
MLDKCLHIGHNVYTGYQEPLNKGDKAVMVFVATLPIGLFMACLIYGMYQALDIETHWQDPPYDWNFEDEELWLTEPALLDYQSRED